MKLGGQYQKYHWLEGAVPQNVFGDFTFTGAFTGLGFADFASGKNIPSRIRTKISLKEIGGLLSAYNIAHLQFRVDEVVYCCCSGVIALNLVGIISGYGIRVRCGGRLPGL